MSMRFVAMTTLMFLVASNPSSWFSNSNMVLCTSLSPVSQTNIHLNINISNRKFVWKIVTKLLNVCKVLMDNHSIFEGEKVFSSPLQLMTTWVLTILTGYLCCLQNRNLASTSSTKLLWITTAYTVSEREKRFPCNRPIFPRICP